MQELLVIPQNNPIGSGCSTEYGNTFSPGDVGPLCGTAGQPGDSSLPNAENRGSIGLSGLLSPSFSPPRDLDRTLLARQRTEGSALQPECSPQRPASSTGNARCSTRSYPHRESCGGAP